MVERFVYTEDVRSSNLLSRTKYCGCSSGVERLLAKQNVASSNLAIRSSLPCVTIGTSPISENPTKRAVHGSAQYLCLLPSGKAAVCLTVKAGSSPVRRARTIGRLDFAFSSLVRSERKMDKSRHERVGGCVTI